MRGKDAFFAELLALAESEGIGPLWSACRCAPTARTAKPPARRATWPPAWPPHRSARVPHAGTAQLHEAESRLRQAGTVQGDLRLVDMAALPDVQLTDAEALEDDDAQE